MDELTLPPTPASIAAARRFVERATAPAYSHLCDVACLVVSELATNAALHGATDYVVKVETLDDGVRITVGDHGAGMPARRDPGPTDVRGRGLRIVEALADAWGVVPASGTTGKCVWFELRTRH
jgi:anti-sigma regulatory factor (Ser/Thr protein kinase)